MKKIIGQLSAVIFVAAGFFAGASQNAFVNYPRVPNQPEGRIAPYLVKGVVVYITAEQRQLVSWTNWIFIGSGLICLLAILFYGGDPFKPVEPRKRASTSERATEGDRALSVHARNMNMFSILKKFIGTTAAAITLIMWAFYKYLDGLFVLAIQSQRNRKTTE